jgi:hypothetical protein
MRMTSTAGNTDRLVSSPAEYWVAALMLSNEAV